MPDEVTKIIIIGDVQYNLIAFFNECDEETTDPAEAVKVLAQLPKDKRPQGVNQTYQCFRVPKGTFEEATIQ